MNKNTPKGQDHDLLGPITQIVRDAIADGLILSDNLVDFDRTVKVLKGPELEDYLQRLWDEL